MIDFHGSTGYGQAFTDSISGHWGDRPLEDLKKGWAHALRQYPELDGGRACALGGSYGGYMVNWIAGVWNEPWDCFVSHAGVFDNRAMAYTTEELWFTEWENEGLPWERPQNYEKFNPVNHVAKWTKPILVIQGEQDFRIPYTQSIGAFTAAQRRGIPSRYLRFPDENHWILKPQNSVQWHEEVEAWLNRWTGGTPAVVAAGFGATPQCRPPLLRRGAAHLRLRGGPKLHRLNQGTGRSGHRRPAPGGPAAGRGGLGRPATPTATPPCQTRGAEATLTGMPNGDYRNCQLR
jgi:hypothetical protein